MSLLESFKNRLYPVADENEEEDMTSAWAVTSAARSRGADREVSIRTTTRLKVVVAQPRRLEDVPAVADDLKDMMTIILNMEGVERETARRILDTISGAAYALDAGISRIASNTYMIVPYNVNFEGDLMSELTSSGLLSGGLHF